MTRCVAIIAAVSVLWHTTAGCCAHHGHEESLCQHAAVVDGHADHGHADHGGGSCDPRGHAAPDSPDSSECGEGTCAFAVPDARASVELDAPRSGFFLTDCVLIGQACLGPLAFSDASASTPPFLLGALPLHLALGVLLL